MTSPPLPVGWSTNMEKFLKFNLTNLTNLVILIPKMGGMKKEVEKMRKVSVLRGRIRVEFRDKSFYLPIISTQHWEVETEEGGFIDEEGYIYETPYGKVITQIIGDKEEVVSCQLDWEALKLPA